MRNTSLKKIGALALAAVMAVTFAPVASLNAFAVEQYGNATTDITTPAPEIVKGGTYTIKKSAGVTVAVTFSDSYAGGDLVLNIEGADNKVTINGSNFGDNKLTINGIAMYDATTKKNKYATVAFETAGANGDVAISGDLIMDTASVGVAAAAVVDKKKAFGSSPVATDGTKYYIGNTCISDKIANGNPMQAENGDVVISDMPAACVATMDKEANAGTTLKATAGKDISLATVVTKYTYNYTGQVNVANDVNATREYVQTAYATAGDAAAVDLSNNAAVPNFTTGTNVEIRHAEADKGLQADATITSVKYDRQITLDLAANDVKKFKNTLDSINDNDGRYDPTDFTGPLEDEDVEGITWFTEDYNDFLSATTVAKAVYDGNKNVYGASVAAAAKEAESTIEVTRGNGWTKADGNKVANLTFDLGGNIAVKVTAPEDTSVFELTTNDATLSKPTHVKKVFVGGYGTYGNAATDATTFAATKATPAPANFSIANNAQKENLLKVAQIAKGKTVQVIGAAIENRDAVTAESGVAFYRTVQTAASDDYVFGMKDAATKAYTMFVGEATYDGVTTQPGIKGTLGKSPVYASKEIVTTVKKVPAGVVLLGEISQELLSTAADKTTSWSINGGYNVNDPQKVYRFVNLKSGEHLYTIQASEIASLLANPEWKIERSDAFTVLPWNTTVEGAVKVRRFMNLKTGEFLYSTDAKESADLEKDPNWNGGGVAFCGVAKDKGYVITRVRCIVNNAHVYCTSKTNEVEPLVATGLYEVEGWPFYAVETPEKEK